MLADLFLIQGLVESLSLQMRRPSTPRRLNHILKTHTQNAHKTHTNTQWGLALLVRVALTLVPPGPRLNYRIGLLRGRAVNTQAKALTSEVTTRVSREPWLGPASVAAACFGYKCSCAKMHV